MAVGIALFLTSLTVWGVGATGTALSTPAYLSHVSCILSAICILENVPEKMASADDYNFLVFSLYDKYFLKIPFVIFVCGLFALKLKPGIRLGSSVRLG